jgi:hypothetical protein
MDALAIGNFLLEKPAMSSAHGELLAAAEGRHQD